MWQVGEVQSIIELRRNEKALPTMKVARSKKAAAIFEESTGVGAADVIQKVPLALSDEMKV